MPHASAGWAQQKTGSAAAIVVRSQTYNVMESGWTRSVRRRAVRLLGRSDGIRTPPDPPGQNALAECRRSGAARSEPLEYPDYWLQQSRHSARHPAFRAAASSASLATCRRRLAAHAASKRSQAARTEKLFRRLDDLADGIAAAAHRAAEEGRSHQGFVGDKVIVEITTVIILLEQRVSGLDE